jgi:hypothetical protein
MLAGVSLRPVRQMSGLLFVEFEESVAMVLA